MIRKILGYVFGDKVAPAGYTFNKSTWKMEVKVLPTCNHIANSSNSHVSSGLTDAPVWRNSSTAKQDVVVQREPIDNLVVAKPKSDLTIMETPATKSNVDSILLI